jgi:hypothetical protein
MKSLIQKEIVILSHEGIVSQMLEVRLDGIRVCLDNNPETWKAIKIALDMGKIVRCERTMWGGEVKKFDWKGSPSYNCRFGKEATNVKLG